MELIGNFGLDWKLLLGQIVNFLIIVVIFKKFLYAPIMKVLDDREEKIKKTIEDSRKTSELLENAGKQTTDMMMTAKLEAQGIVDNAKKAAEEIKNEMISVSKTEAEKIVERAKSQAELEMQKMERSMKELSLGLSQKILASVVENVFSKEDKENFLKRSLEKINTKKPN